MLHKPKYTSSIILKFPGSSSMSPELLQKLFTENNSAWGMAVRTSKGIEIEKFPKMGDPSAEVKEFEGILSNIKAFPALISLHSMPKEFDEDEIQPWCPVKDSKGNPIIAVAIEGDFHKHTNSEDGNSEPMEFLQKWLGPKLEQAYKMSGNSPDKLFEYIKSAQFNTDFVEQIGHRAVLSFMPSKGDSFTIEKNEIGDKGEYGDVSNSYGYKTPVPVKEKVEQKPKAEAEPEAPKRSKWATEDEPQPVKPEVQPPALPEQPPKGPIEQVAKEIVEQDWTPPPQLHGKKLKQTYREVYGSLPSNWEDRPTVKIKVERVVKSLAELPKLGATTETTVDKNGVYTMPVLDGKKLAAVNELIQKHLGDGSAVISDPKEMAEEIKRLAKFTDVVKGFKDLDDIDRVRTSFIFNLAKNHSEALALLVIQLREDRRQLKAMLEQMTAPGEKKDGDTTVPQPDPQTVQQPEPKVAAAGGKNKYL